MKSHKKLIEVALPLEAINKASAREKSIRHGHPSTLHLWWARRPLAAARAVIFAQMVDDPSAYVDTLRQDPKLRRKAEAALRARLALWDEAAELARRAKGTNLAVPEPGPQPTLDEMLADIERQRLFRIIEDLVLWESTTNETVLQAGRDEIWASWRRTCAENADHPRAKDLFDRKTLPAFHDPFAGGGALPLEAQRLGLESYASDLNPVAVLINKAMIEIPPKFARKPPVNPVARKEKSLIAREWKGAQGLAEDVRYYGQWMRDEADKRMGHLYPKVEVTAEMAQARPDLKQYAGEKLTVIAWLWARTVKSPNPAFAKVDVPLASTFMLSTKVGKEAYVEPVIENGGYRFTVKVGKPKDAEGAKRGTKSGSSGSSFLCLLSGTPMPFEYLRTEAKAGRMGARLMAIVAEGERGRVYLPPTPAMEAVAQSAKPNDAPETDLPARALGFRVQEYGMTKWCDLFTSRQLVALTTFSDLVLEARERVQRDALAAGLPDDKKPLRDGGVGTSAYGDAVASMLACAVDKAADYWSTICFWHNGAAHQKIVNTFGRQAIPMSWDFAEGNPFSTSSGHFLRFVSLIAEVLDVAVSGAAPGRAEQQDAARTLLASSRVVSTDPPYFDNIGYADLSDFFYVWLRRSLKPVFPELFATLAVPKAEELVATPFRHGNKEKAEAFFLDGMTHAMHRLAEQAHPGFPVTIYYAFKQSESDALDGTASTGWETFLEAVILAGFGITGTWPVRTEYTGNLKKNISALASSIVLVCRPRDAGAPTATRREFVTALKAELPVALAHLQRGNIAPVDLAQAAIGPGMAVYTRYAKVLDAEGKALSVREALALINQTLGEALAEQEGDFDADSRFALTWFEQHGFAEGPAGEAILLSTAKATALNGLEQAGIIKSGRGNVRLLRPEELPADWDPATDPRLTAWEIVHQLIRVLGMGGEGAAAGLVTKLGAKAEIGRELAYRLYTLCERKKRAAEALAYNGLVQSWPEIVRLAREGGKPRAEQGALFGETEE
jgi:putative DNA methylase